MQERPLLRPYLYPERKPTDPHHVYLVDQLRLLPGPVPVPRRDLPALELFDGRRNLRDVQAEVARRDGGAVVPLEHFAQLAARLDEAQLLDGPRFRAAVNGPVREPSCIGCYPGEPVALRHYLGHLFTGPHGPGVPRRQKPDGRLRAALIPHIDYGRGGLTYAWGFKEVFERTDASLFVIIGTSHCWVHHDTLGHHSDSARRFTLTRKDFKTPLGVVPTDRRYIDRLVRHHGDGLFDGELIAHLPEHSIELEVVFLQYLYEGVRPIRIVPLVVSSFQDCVAAGAAPSACADIERMVRALRAVEAETDEPVCYIISGDLAHIGPKFDRRSPPLTRPVLSHSRTRDEAVLRQAEAADPARFFQVIADEGDRRNICGLPPTYTTLAAVRPGRGKLLHYDQYVQPDGYESVSFASVAFYR